MGSFLCLTLGRVMEHRNPERPFEICHGSYRRPLVVPVDQNTAMSHLQLHFIWAAIARVYEPSRNF